MKTTEFLSDAPIRTSPRRWLLGALLLVGLTTSVPAAAHPVHATMAEVEWNPKTKRYEVALQFTVTDLERALAADGASERAAPKKAAPKNAVRLAETKAGALLAAKVVNEHFFALRAGQKVAMHVVGLELGPKIGWLYFTWDAGGERIDTIRSDLFFDAAQSQLNTVVLTQRAALGEAKRQSHSFTERRPGPWLLKN